MLLADFPTWQRRCSRARPCTSHSSSIPRDFSAPRLTPWNNAGRATSERRSCRLPWRLSARCWPLRHGGRLQHDLTSGWPGVGSVVPFTLAVMWPTNKRLEDPVSIRPASRSQSAGTLGTSAWSPFRAEPACPDPHAVCPGVTFGFRAWATSGERGVGLVVDGHGERRALDRRCARDRLDRGSGRP